MDNSSFFNEIKDVFTRLHLRNWTYLLLVIFILLLLAFVYVYAHSTVSGSRERELTKEEIAAVTTILLDTSIHDKGFPQKFVLKSPSQQAGITDTALHVTVLDSSVYKMKKDSADIHARKDSAVSYIFSVTQPPQTVNTVLLRKKLMGKNIEEFKTTAALLSIPTHSYFWLSGERKYLEVIFWTIFGVLTSILYFVSEALRKGDFRRQEFYVYWAKIFYAPVISLVIFLSIDILTRSNELTNVNQFSESFLVLSFVLGFFSGRAVELLNKLKDVLLPGGKTDATPAEIYVTGRVIVPADFPKKDISKIKLTLISAVNESVCDETVPNDEGDFLLRSLYEGIFLLEAKTLFGGKEIHAEVENIKLSIENKIKVVEIKLSE